MPTDNRAIKQRDPRKLNADELRTLVRFCDNSTESFWFPVGGPLSLAGILHMYHAMCDADYGWLEDWWQEAPEAARLAFQVARDLGR